MPANRLTIPLRWLKHGRGLPLPAQQTAGAAGLDLAAALPAEAVIDRSTKATQG